MQIQGPRNRFIARPFWRDYVVALLVTGFGVVLIDIGGSQPGATWIVKAPGLVLAALGLLIFTCAIGWSLWAMWRSWRAGDDQ